MKIIGLAFIAIILAGCAAVFDQTPIQPNPSNFIKAVKTARGDLTHPYFWVVVCLKTPWQILISQTGPHHTQIGGTLVYEDKLVNPRVDHDQICGNLIGQKSIPDTSETCLTNSDLSAVMITKRHVVIADDSYDHETKPCPGDR